MAITTLNDLTNAVNQVQQNINNNNPLNQTPQQQFKSDGFLLPSTFSADGTGLPFSKVPSNKKSQLKRNIMTWFIPEFGIVRMYVNPSRIQTTHKKIINRDKTKGGFTLQYWGEELDVLNISGTTGSAGVEGINVLYEIYRAEQYAFDGIGLTLAANNAAADISNNLINGLGGSLGGAINGLFGGDPNSPTAAAGGAGLLGGILGLDSPNNTLSAKNIPSLAQLAFTVELYYAGKVYRGYFENMTITESADNFLLQYDMNFVVTQTRGYRTNRFGWERSAADGPSQYTSPNSFSGNVSNG